MEPEALGDVLYGLCQADEGEIVLDGEVRHFAGPGDAVPAGGRAWWPHRNRRATVRLVAHETLVHSAWRMGADPLPVARPSRRLYPQIHPLPSVRVRNVSNTGRIGIYGNPPRTP
ncbi:hypothetical protein GHK92_04945 [Nocardioides sp. dk4132]|nr:hypothetical protein [Nocardioides sp. dk4132]QGA07634.1 hypothetical protein GFH29_09655 [Nocardioides sp. dk884]